MEKVTTPDADVLAYRSGNFRSILGPLLLVAGGVLVFEAHTLLPPDRSAILGLLGVISIGLTIVGVVGLVRALVRSGFILDRADGTVTTWRRAVVLLSRKTLELAAFETVLLSPARLQKRYVSRMVYVVGLDGDAVEPLPLDAAADYGAARRFAEEVAGFLRLPWTDASGTESVVHGGEPHHRPPRAAPAAPPAGMKCRVSWRGSTLVIEEPPVGWRELLGPPLALFLVLGLPFLVLGVISHFLDDNPSPVNAAPLTGAAVLLGMLSVIFLAVVLSSLPQLYRRRLVEADRDGVRFTAKGPFATRDRRIRSADIAELRIALGQLAVVTPRDWRVVCGRLHHPLSRAELEWLRDQLSKALKG
jgi:hypothetical protein